MLNYGGFALQGHARGAYGDCYNSGYLALDLRVYLNNCFGSNWKMLGGDASVTWATLASIECDNSPHQIS